MLPNSGVHTQPEHMLTGPHTHTFLLLLLFAIKHYGRHFGAPLVPRLWRASLKLSNEPLPPSLLGRCSLLLGTCSLGEAIGLYLVASLQRARPPAAHAPCSRVLVLPGYSPLLSCPTPDLRPNRCRLLPTAGWHSPPLPLVLSSCVCRCCYPPAPYAAGMRRRVCR